MTEYYNINIPLEIWGALICFLAAGVTAAGKSPNKQAARILFFIELLNGFLLIVEAFSWYFRGDPRAIGLFMSRITIVASLLMDLFVELLFCLYIYFLLEEGHRKESMPYVNAAGLTALIEGILIVSSLITGYAFYFDKNNAYYRGDGFDLMIFLYALQLIILFALVISKRKYLQTMYIRHLIIYIIILVSAVAAQIFYYGLDIINTAVTICVLIAFYNFQIEQAKLREHNDSELQRLQSEIVLAQVRPHFIYNTLNTIKFLCHEDPKEAMAAIDELAVYLRNNTDNLNQDRTETIEECIQNVDNYIAICKRRFGDRLHIEYNIKDEDIDVPAFTVQPLVENALKHGILKKPEGGTIIVSAWNENNKSYIEIQDDGVGFDINNVGNKNDGRRHVGVQNVETRINKIAGGELVIKSWPGVGTIATIILPKRFDIKKMLVRE